MVAAQVCSASTAKHTAVELSESGSEIPRRPVNAHYTSAVANTVSPPLTREKGSTADWATHSVAC